MNRAEILEKLDELEEKAVELHNKHIELLSEYVKAIKENDDQLKQKISDEWLQLYTKIKAMNKRIVLLKQYL